MVVGAVANLLEDMFGIYKWLLANPGHAFAAHLRGITDIAVHPVRHEVTADATVSAAALREFGRRVMWTS